MSTVNKASELPHNAVYEGEKSSRATATAKAIYESMGTEDNTDTETGETQEVVEENKEELVEEVVEETPTEEVVEETPTEEVIEETPTEEIVVEDTPVTEEIEETEDGPPTGDVKTDPKARAAWKRIREENRRLKDEALLAKGRSEGRSEITKPITESTVETNQSPSAPTSVVIQLKKLDEDYESGKFEGDHNDLLIKKTAILFKDQQDRYEANRAFEQKQARESDILRKAIAARSKVLPKLEAAFINLSANPKVREDNIIGSAILKNLDKGGLDLAYYLNGHPEVIDSLMELSPENRTIELYKHRTRLFKSPAPVLKTNIKPITPIKNGQVSIKPGSSGEEGDSIDSMVAAQTATHRGRNRR